MGNPGGAKPPGRPNDWRDFYEKSVILLPAYQHMSFDRTGFFF
jgi:hypothetical protein